MARRDEGPRIDHLTVRESKYGMEGGEAIRKFHEDIGRMGGGRVRELIKAGKEHEREQKERK